MIAQSVYGRLSDRINKFDIAVRISSLSDPPFLQSVFYMKDATIMLIIQTMLVINLLYKLVVIDRQQWFHFESNRKTNFIILSIMHRILTQFVKRLKN